MLATGLVVAEEKGSLSSRTFMAAEAGLNYGNKQMVEHAIDERIIDRLGLFDPPDSAQSTRRILIQTPDNAAKPGASRAISASIRIFAVTASSRRVGA